MPYAVLQSAFDAFFPKGWLYYWKSLYLDDFDEETMAAIIGYARDRPIADALMALWHLGGGAASRVGAEATAFGRRDAPYLLSFDTTWNDPADTERCIAWTRAAWADMQPLRSGWALPELRRLRRGEGGAGAGRLRRQLRPAGGAEGEVRPGQPLPHEPEHQTRIAQRTKGDDGLRHSLSPSCACIFTTDDSSLKPPAPRPRATSSQCPVLLPHEEPLFHRFARLREFRKDAGEVVDREVGNDHNARVAGQVHNGPCGPRNFDRPAPAPRHPRHVQQTEVSAVMGDKRLPVLGSAEKGLGIAQPEAAELLCRIGTQSARAQEAGKRMRNLFV